MKSRLVIGLDGNRILRSGLCRQINQRLFDLPLRAVRIRSEIRKHFLTMDRIIRIVTGILKRFMCQIIPGAVLDRGSRPV